MLRYVQQKFDNLGIRRLTLEKYDKLARRWLLHEILDILGIKRLM